MSGDEQERGAAQVPADPRPWILGARGVPLEAPENTLCSLRRALELGLDGVAYELRACKSGELVLLADETLERTTDAHGLLELRTLPEISGLDAGGWFGARFAGEPLVLFEEALDLEPAGPGSRPQHLIELRSPGFAPQAARALRGSSSRLQARVATRSRSACLELRDQDLSTLLIADQADEDLAGFLRRERIAACGLSLSSWPVSSREGWPSERWALELDEPAQLLAACRAGIDGLTTREPRRALAARALASLAPQDGRGWPLEAPELAIEPRSALAGGTEWSGSWSLCARVRNPFELEVRVELSLTVARGTFEARGLPSRLALRPGDQTEVSFELRGGSWSPGGDPRLCADYAWKGRRGRPGGQASFDATLHRVRTLRLSETALRVQLLREHPADPPATMTLRRHGAFLLARIESAGGLDDARALVHVDGREHAGAAGLRVRLPEDFDRRPGGVPFSVGCLGREASSGRGGLRLRRWAGGLPREGDRGAPGRLLPAARS